METAVMQGEIYWGVKTQEEAKNIDLPKSNYDFPSYYNIGRFVFNI